MNFPKLNMEEFKKQVKSMSIEDILENKKSSDEAIKIAHEKSKMLKILKKEEKDRAKANKAAKEKEVKEPYTAPMITITVIFNEKEFPVSLSSDLRMKQVRELLMMKYPKVFKSKKMLKNLRIYFNDVDVEEHSRRSLGTGSKGTTGWGMVDGSVLKAFVKGAGGAKRSGTSSSKATIEEKVKEYADVISIARVQTNQQPLGHIVIIMDEVMKVKDALVKNPDLVLSILKTCSTEQLSKLQTLTMGTRSGFKFSGFSCVFFSNFYEQITENMNQLNQSKGAMEALTTLLLIGKYATDGTTNIQWPVVFFKQGHHDYDCGEVQRNRCFYVDEQRKAKCHTIICQNC